MELLADGSEPSTGLLIETEQEQEPGIGLLIGRGGVGRFGPVQADGTLAKAEVSIDRGLPGAREVRFRLVLKRWLLELYVDDILLECFSLPARATGRIGFLGRTAPTELSAWR